MSDKLSYSINEAAQAIGLSRSSLYLHVKAGNVRTFKIGARTLIRREDLAKFVDDHARQSNEVAA